MKNLKKKKGFSTLTAYLKILEIADSAGASSRLTRKPKNELVEIGKGTKVYVTIFSEDMIQQYLKKRNRIRVQDAEMKGRISRRSK